ncbi:translation initiation factor IF-2 [Thermosulfuriphilus ammonigenes]|uniref:Translation initiation factor IF-2 n=1 Tax=Thermosulfuriphilus ammonigenes TaxID=1936021 RepID=A0A6G7PV92_9BACT|nr:translation initiation factor IF-2 [Thermosulfuriphilus ammonigenes]MBA2848229.1 translation initiation factor IF-2 [Thermosulfuriphilus ammonigenes]QIJ71604.1 translation initiation factor IF-2 [Thermosulfuriphilus ammonigenes]
MAKMRVYELAREIGMESKELLTKIRQIGLEVKSHSSMLSEEEVAIVRQKLAGASEESAVGQSRPKVIRRRARPQEPPAEEKPEKPVEEARVVEGPPKVEPKPRLKLKIIRRPKKKEREEAPPEKAVARAPEGPPSEAPTPKAPEEAKKIEETKAEEPKPTKPEPTKPRVVDMTEHREYARVVKRAEPQAKVVKKAPAPPPKGPRPAAPVAKAAPQPAPVEEKGKKKSKRTVEGLELGAPRKKTKKRAARPKSEVSELKEGLELLELERELEKAPLEEVASEGMPSEVTEHPEAPKEKGKKGKTKEAKEPKEAPAPPKVVKKKIKIYESIQVGELAKQMGVKAPELIRKLMELGVMATVNQSIDYETAALVASEFGHEVERAGIQEEDLLRYEPPKPEELKPRPPVVTVMGHVDHGKTSLLDAIRKTDVVAREAGGITQHIGAYFVKLEDGREIVFIDTPGHEAFTTMRARGAQVTDIVILVVAADDGVMDQTREAIDHARAAGVPVVVAINKIDKPEANPERVKSQLAELGLVPEEWGGETLYAEVSAKKRIGIRDLLELVLLQAEVMELKAAPDRPARGRIIESRLDRGRGPVATVIIQEGTLRVGDPFVSGYHYGRVRAMFDDRGKKLKEAGPAYPVEVLGFSGVPQAGDDFIVVESEKVAKEVAEYRERKLREAEVARAGKVSLEKLFERLKESEIKELKVILKADVQGSLEALSEALRKLSTDEVRVNIIRSGIGAISESDIMLASASDAVVIGFNVRPTPKAKELANQEKIDVRFYDVIYNVVDDVKKAMVGLLEPTYEERVIGVAEVRATFKVPKVGVVAGCYVREGRLERGAKVRLLRDNVVVYTGKIASLRRFKEDVKEVAAGYECGVGLENFNDIKVGDLIEAFELVEIKPEL